MKRIIVSAVATFVIMATAWAQSSTELRPNWAYAVPSVPAGANYFLSWGVGEGSDEQSATNAAWADALQRSLHELGVVGITGQDIDAVALHGINAVVKFNRMKRRVVSATEPIALAGGRMKVYVLIQVQRNVNGADDFYSLDTNRYRDRGFERSLAEYNASITGKYPFSGRVFVPGWAQLHKGSRGKGVFFIVAEAAAVGGIVTCESLRHSYKSKASSAFDTNQKRRYDSRATNCTNVRNGFIVGAAAIYVWNVIDGIAARGKKQPLMVGDARLHISPYAVPQESGVLFSLSF